METASDAQIVLKLAASLFVAGFLITVIAPVRSLWAKRALVACLLSIGACALYLIWRA